MLYRKNKGVIRLNENYEYNHKALFKLLPDNNFSLKQKEYIVNTVTNKIRQINDYCMNNFRLAIKGHESEKQYNSIKNKGCCAFFDVEIVLKNKVIVLFGFNYGH